MKVFEVSWEVCNKVGGINTVIKSKASLMEQEYGLNYFLVGPYFKENAEIELENTQVPPHLSKVFSILEKEGIKCHFGLWTIRGDPQTILIDFSGVSWKKDELKKYLWDNYKIDSLNSHWDFEEPMLFSYAVSRLLEEIEKNEQVIGHFHEWMTGISLLYLKKSSKIATVFTTHATILGRSIAGSNQPLYQMLDTINPDEKAYEVGVQDKHTTEKACALTCDIFTTVSDITGLEAEKLLGRKPDILLYNGLSLEKFPTIEETTIRHVTSREAIREFLAYCFFPYYNFDLEHTLIYYFAARYEYHNKGLDILTEALKRLNKSLKKENINRTVCCIFWTPLQTYGVKKEIIENKNYYYHIKGYVDWHAQKILRELTFNFLKDSKKEVPEKFFTTEFLKNLRKDLQRFKRIGNPPISTHEIDSNNQLFQGLLRAGLDNRPDDKVKVLIYPVYLEGSDSLLNLPFYEAIVGTHLGIFPSYYEPWGYTPLESAALAVPAITTDLAGFGLYFQQQHKRPGGVFIIPRYQKSWEEEVEGLHQKMLKYAKLDHAERVENRLMAKNFASLADWKHFVKYYFNAHKEALKKVKKL